MKAFYLIIFFSTYIFGQSQTVFSKVRECMLVSSFKTPLEQLDSCIAKNYHKDSALFYKGIIYVKVNSLKDANLNCNLLSKDFPEFLDAHFLSGLILCAEKNYGKSIVEFSTVIAKRPNHLQALYNRSIAFGLSENYKKAIEDLNACIALKPMYSQAYYSRAHCQELLGDHAKAAKDYETTINIDPKNFDAYFGLAYIYRNQKEKSKSCDVINNAIKSGSQMAEDLKEMFCN